MTVLKQRYANIVKQVYESTLRGAGYRRTGTNCHKFVSPNIIHIVNFQKSVYSDSHEISFTVNLGVYRKGVRTVLMPEAPEPRRPSISDCIIEERLGRLMPAGLDKWWEITDTSDLQIDNLVASEVSTALNDYGLPFLATFESDEAILQYVLRQLSPQYPLLETIRAVALAWVLQRRDTASHLLGIALAKAERVGNKWVEWISQIANHCSLDIKEIIREHHA
ncbi:MAG: DUF4304 domain-containing protein [Thermofilaceae archaeon]